MLQINEQLSFLAMLDLLFISTLCEEILQSLKQQLYILSMNGSSVELLQFVAYYHIYHCNNMKLHNHYVDTFSS